MVMIQNDFYDDKEVESITKELNLIESDNLIKEFICEWVQTKEMQNILLERPSHLVSKTNVGNIKIRIIKKFIHFVGEFIVKQESFTWENYCKIQHEISKIKDHVRPYKLALREMTQNFYLYTMTSKIIKNEKVKEYIKQYSNLLLKEEIKQVNKAERNHFILNNIMTNFPLDSTVEQVINREFVGTSGRKISTNNFIYSNNKFLLNIIGKFIGAIKLDNNYSLRLFIAYFNDSLDGLQINKFENFSEKTFEMQLKYFNSFFKQQNPKAKWRPITLLVKFYRFIDDLYLEEYGVRLFNSFSFNRDIITHMHYQKKVEDGFEIININSIGKCPNCDKWFVVADIEKSGSHIANVSNFLLDFELIENTEYRNDLKDYIWNLELIYKNIPSHFAILKDFLNEADAYHKKEMKVLPLRNECAVDSPLLGLNDRRAFSNRFLIYYHASLISNEEWSSKTINTYISIIHLFLKKFQGKYNISAIQIDQFRQISVEAKGGTPISVEDFKEIHKEFKSRIRTKEDELLLIIFQLTIETKLRTGEILGLERDCIDSIDISGKFGTIRYYRKTSDNEYQKEVFIIEHIRLIQKALQLTKENHEKAESSFRNFIFIGAHYAYQNKIAKLGWRFYDYFKNIIEELFNQNKIKVKYKPNSLRDTYIERAWQMVEDGLVSTMEVSVITGNTASVAAKHYRNRDNTRRYIEALYEVTILDDEIQGDIVGIEEVQNLPPVQNGAGSCSSESCIKEETIEDSSYKCLTCKKFVTTIERASHYEQKLKEYKNKKDNSTSTVEKNFYISLMELYGAYLSEMYSIMEEKK